jgi:hypothetical protein
MLRPKDTKASLSRVEVGKNERGLEYYREPERPQGLTMISQVDMIVKESPEG